MDATTVYFSKANRVTGIIVLVFLPAFAGMLPIVTDEASRTSPAMLLLTCFMIIFSLYWLAKLTSRITFNHEGVTGRWFFMPVSAPWAKIESAKVWRNSLGNGISVQFKVRHNFIKRIQLSNAFEGFTPTKKLLEARGYKVTA